jgi:hypothetical protein
LAWGYGAEFVVIVPSPDLVVVTLVAAPGAQELGKRNAGIMGLMAQIVALAGGADAFDERASSHSRLAG